MNATECAALLRRFNAWRRGEDDTIEQPHPKEIGLAIDMAVDLIGEHDPYADALVAVHMELRRVEKQRDGMVAALRRIGFEAASYDECWNLAQAALFGDGGGAA